MSRWLDARGVGYFLVKNAKYIDSAKFLVGTLSTEDGTIDFKFDMPKEDADGWVNSIVCVYGRVSQYNGNPQIQGNVRHLTPSELANPNIIRHCVPVSKFDSAELYNSLHALLNTVSNSTLRDIALRVVETYRDDLLVLPGGKTVHHAWIGGLIEHVWHVAQGADRMASLYGDRVNRDLLVVGAALHDIGKVREFKIADTGLVEKYTAEGNLLSHLIIGANMVVQCAGSLWDWNNDILIQLYHILISHHSVPEFGNARTPMTLEADIIGHLDIIDSRVCIYNTEYGKLDTGETSNNIWALGHSIFKGSNVQLS